MVVVCGVLWIEKILLTADLLEAGKPQLVLSQGSALKPAFSNLALGERGFIEQGDFGARMPMRGEGCIILGCK